MYHKIKLGCKKISSSVDMVERVIFDYLSPHCDPNLKTANQSSCMTPARDDASPYQVWLQIVQQLRRYQPDKSLEF